MSERGEGGVVGNRHSWDGEPDRLNPLRFLLLLLFVGGIVAVIWWAYTTGHIKHVETVPPPITAPPQQ
jgi:hypothetical protein